MDLQTTNVWLAVIAITGGGAGICRTYAHRFAEEGANVVIADLDPANGLVATDREPAHVRAGSDRRLR